MLRTIALSLTALVATTLVGCGEAPMIATAPVQPAAAQSVARAPQVNPVVALATAELKKIDTNHDGVLSQAEYVNARFAELRFVKAPTPAEISTVKGSMAKKFDALDTNHDTKLTAAEFAKDYI